MEVYVIKNTKDNLYYKNNVEWVKDISNAKLFDDKEYVDAQCKYVNTFGWKCIKPVPITIVESDRENAKAVETLEELKRRLYESHYHDETNGRHSVYMEENEEVINQLIKEYGGKND